MGRLIALVGTSSVGKSSVAEQLPRLHVPDLIGHTRTSRLLSFLGQPPSS